LTGSSLILCAGFHCSRVLAAKDFPRHAENFLGLCLDPECGLGEFAMAWQQQ
jgi:hypothetical protein